MKVEVLGISPFEQPLCEAILIASNDRMQMVDDLSEKVHRLAGSGLRAHCERLPPLAVGSALVTPGFDCPFQWIVHAIPVNYFNSSAPLSGMTRTLLAVLEAADAAGIHSLCLGAFGTGSAQIPAGAVANITMRTLGEEIGLLDSLELVRFCITNSNVHDSYLGAARVRNVI